VINDFQSNLAARGFKIYFYDARVEGSQAVNDIRQGIKWFNKKMPGLDVLVIIRGGGSLEDLQAFNNELVARDLFASQIPTISGIGHDQDVPIASLVADRAVSTPTAAAHLINESWGRLATELPGYEQGMVNIFATTLENMNNELIYYLEKLINSFDQTLLNCKESLSAKERYLTSVNPGRQLKLGYSIAFNKQGKVIKSIKDVKVGERIKSKLYKGRIDSQIKKIIK
jgi:exodeoxyribonuclease VII large subunit